MKRKYLIIILLISSVLALLTACSAKSESTSAKDSSGVDIDLTKMSKTMIYSEVFNMVNSPEKYIGKTVRLKGNFSWYINNKTRETIPAVIVQDAAACCSQGVEFSLCEGDQTPMPEVGDEMTIQGCFETYEKASNRYWRLKDTSIL